MIDWLAAILLVAGTALMLLAAIGVVRFPDLFTRMQAATKAGTLGAGSVLAATALHSGQSEVVAHAIAIIVFLMLTAPTAAHRIARAAYRAGVPLWSGTQRDELRAALDAAAATTPAAAGKDDAPAGPRGEPAAR